MINTLLDKIKIKTLKEADFALQVLEYLHSPVVQSTTIKETWLNNYIYIHFFKFYKCNYNYIYKYKFIITYINIIYKYFINIIYKCNYHVENKINRYQMGDVVARKSK